MQLIRIVLVLLLGGVVAACGGVEARRLEAERAAVIRAEMERLVEEQAALELAEDEAVEEGVRADTEQADAKESKDGNLPADSAEEQVDSTAEKNE